MSVYKKGFLALLFLFLGWFWFSYIHINGEILKKIEKRDLSGLKNIVILDGWNWYQKGAAIEGYAYLSCEKKDTFLSLILHSNRIDFRRSLYTGCYKKKESSREWLLDYGLKDSYSYNRFISLEFLERVSNKERWKESLLKLKKDSSSMVKNKALEIKL